jgi:integrase
MSKILTEAAVRRLKASSKRRIIRDGGSRSLFLVVSPSGHKSWAMRFRRPEGGSSKMVLGAVDLSGRRPDGEPVIGQPLSLVEARRLAARINSDRAAGIDVLSRHKAIKHRRHMAIAEAASNSFLTAAHDFVSEHAKVKLRTWRTLARTLGLNEKFLPRPGGLADRWCNRDVRTITANDLHVLIEEARSLGIPGVAVLRTNTTESRAYKIHSALSSMFRWLHRRRRIDINPMIQLHSPPLPPSRDRVMSDTEIAKFWVATDEIKLPVGDALKLLLLTGCRVSEIARLEWSEVSDDGSVLTISGSRTKNGLALVIPLSQIAIEIVARQPRSDTFVFTMKALVPVSLGSKVKSRLDQMMGDVPSWRLHDLRRTAATGMASINVPPHVIEACLNHSSGFRGGIGGVYNRYGYLAEKREALGRWADHLESIVGDPR